MSSGNVTHQARNSANKMRNAAEEMKDAAEEKASDLMGTVKQVGADIARAAQDKFEDVRETAGEYLDQGRAKARELERSVEKRIQQQPLTALLVAVGIGFAIGFVCTRR